VRAFPPPVRGNARTRAGRIAPEIPKLRKGSYFPGFLEPRRTAEKALVALDHCS
jgi:transposase-like protein